MQTPLNMGIDPDDAEGRWRRFTTTREGASLVLLRGGDCNHDVEHGENNTCPFSARFMLMDSGEVQAERCAHHTDEDWSPPHERDGTDGVYDLQSACDKMVSSDPTGDMEAGLSSPCGDLAFVRVISPDGTTKDHCRTHAKDLWLDQLRIE